MSGAELDAEIREAYLAAHEPLGEDPAVAEERYRALVTSSPGQAILDLYGATESAVEAVLSAHVVDTPSPGSSSRIPRELPVELVETYSLQAWVRAQRASLAGVQVLVEHATANNPIDLPSTAFPAQLAQGSAVAVPLRMGPEGALRWVDIEYAVATLPSSIHPGPETVAALRAAGFDGAYCLAPVTVAITPRLSLAGSAMATRSVPQDLARLANSVLSTLCPGVRQDPTNLIASRGSVDVDGMSLG